MLNAYTSSPFAPLDPFPRMLLVELHGCRSMLACRTDCRTLRTKALECWVATTFIGFDREVAGYAKGRLGPSRTPCSMVATSFELLSRSAAVEGVAR